MKPTILILLAILIVLVASTVIHAQPEILSNPDQAPIDGGLGLLAAAGGTYAWKKLRDMKKE